MPLKTVVKVGNISNLSDARYCSGMGVDMLGFRVIEGQDNYLSPKLYQEIRGWVTGPKIVAEIYGISSADQLAKIIEDYAPDYLELSATEFNRFAQQLTLPCIVSGEVSHSSNILYCVIEEQSLQKITTLAKVLVQPGIGANVLELISSNKIAGLALNGAPEVRPGFKDYSDLADILEKLDED
jgi:phosphoribosylanthranilate isomerase